MKSTKLINTVWISSSVYTLLCIVYFFFLSKPPLFVIPDRANIISCYTVGYQHEFGHTKFSSKDSTEQNRILDSVQLSPFPRKEFREFNWFLRHGMKELNEKFTPVRNKPFEKVALTKYSPAQYWNYSVCIYEYKSVLTGVFLIDEPGGSMPSHSDTYLFKQDSNGYWQYIKHEDDWNGGIFSHFGIYVSMYGLYYVWPTLLLFTAIILMVISFIIFGIRHYRTWLSLKRYTPVISTSALIVIGTIVVLRSLDILGFGKSALGMLELTGILLSIPFLAMILVLALFITFFIKNGSLIKRGSIIHLLLNSFALLIGISLGYLDFFLSPYFYWWNPIPLVFLLLSLIGICKVYYLGFSKKRQSEQVSGQSR